MAHKDPHAEASVEDNSGHAKVENAPRAVPEANLPVTNLVFAGTGDVVDRFWGPALKHRIDSERGKRRFVVTLVDNSSFFSHDPDLKHKMEGIIQDKLNWAKEPGSNVEVHYIDLANKDEAEKQLAALKNYKLAVTTPDRFHMSTVKEFLDRKNPPDEIFVEKPLDSDVQKVVAMQARLRKDGKEGKVFGVDHYRATLSQEQVKSIKKHVGKIKRITFYLVENHSGSDPNYKSDFKDKDGAIEVEARNKALAFGLIPDLFSHGPPQVGLLGKQETIVPTAVRPLQYVGVNGHPNQRAGIKGETAAGIKFTMMGDDGQPIECVAYVGKDIRGVKSIGPEYDSDVSVMEVEGENGKHVRVFGNGPHKTQGQLKYYDGNKVVKNEALPALRYLPIIDAIMNDNSDDRFPLMPFHMGLKTAQVVHDVHAPVLQLINQGIPLPTYPGGMAARPAGGKPGKPIPRLPGRKAQYLEPVMASPGAKWIAIPGPVPANVPPDAQPGP